MQLTLVYRDNPISRAPLLSGSLLLLAQMHVHGYVVF